MGRSARASRGIQRAAAEQPQGARRESVPEPRGEAAGVLLPVGGIDGAAEHDRVPILEAPDLAYRLGGGVMTRSAQHLGDDLGDLTVGPELGGIGDEDASGHGLPWAIPRQVDAQVVNLAPLSDHVTSRGRLRSGHRESPIPTRKTRGPVMTDNPLEGMDWGNRLPAVDGFLVDVSIRFEAGRVSGSTGCNRYTGSCAVGQGTLEVGSIGIDQDGLPARGHGGRGRCVRAARPVDALGARARHPRRSRSSIRKVE